MTAFCELLAPMLRLLTARRTNGKLAPSETSALHERESHSASLSRSDSGDDEAMTSMPADDRDDGASTLDSTTMALGTPAAQKALATPGAAPEVPARTMAASQSGLTLTVPPASKAATWSRPVEVCGTNASRTQLTRYAGAPSSTSMAILTQERLAADAARTPSATCLAASNGMSLKPVMALP